jgi:hypothetical protein
MWKCGHLNLLSPQNAEIKQIISFKGVFGWLSFKSPQKHD